MSIPQTFPLSTLLGLLAGNAPWGPTGPGQDREMVCVYKTERARTNIFICPRNSFIVAGWTVAKERVWLTHLSWRFCVHGATSQNCISTCPLHRKGGECLYFPSLPPSPPAFQPLSFVEADTTYSEMRRLIICCLIKFQLVIFKIIVCISELIILYYLHVSTFIVKCSHMSEMFRGPVAGPSVL